MAAPIPVQTWGRLVSPNEDEIPAQALGEMPSSVSITMAALDPNEEWSNNAGVDKFKGKKPRATIKMIVYPPEPYGDDESDDEDEDDETDPMLAQLLDEEAESDDSDDNGEGPSDINKSPQARLAQEMLGHNNVNGVAKKSKGKAKADLDEDMSEDIDLEDDSEEMDDEDDLEGLDAIPDEYVLCTLDPDSHYQQPMNLTISRNENVFFRVEGTHSVHLTGNYLADEEGSGPYDSDDEYDLSPDEDELADLPSDLEDDEDSDELDDMADPRIMEVDSDEDDEDEAPKLVKSAPGVQKGKNKRVAAPSSDDEVEDVVMEEAAKPAANGLPTIGADGKPLSKNQLKKMRKKLKDNAGNAVETVAAEADAKGAAANGKGDKKVQFAKTLVQGPTGSDSPAAGGKKDSSAGGKKEKDYTSRVVDGVTVEDRKAGTGPAAKKGDRVSMRYIGKLDDKRVFDANKKGAPFSFKLGKGEVIRGWDVGLAGIQPGGERRLIIPAHLAYGSQKAGTIPPNSRLTFDVRCLDVKS